MDEIWKNILNNIKDEVNPLAFQTWFMPLEFIDIKDNNVRLLVNNLFHKTHIENNYKQLLVNNFNILLDEPINNIKLILKENYKDLINEEKKEKEIKTSSNIEFEKIDSNLIKNYTFETFVVGEQNKFAQAAALAVAENPGTIYNPLFLYGNSGLGKTHLMHAIGNYIENNTLKKVLYVTSDQFITDFIGLSRQSNSNNLDNVEKFKEKYRNIDVLLIDDIQFLGTAVKTQEEFFHTFNTLYNENKQIIISSDRSPNDLNILEERLKTRFCWGLTACIEPPDFNLKYAIIRRKLKGMQLNQEIDEQVISYIASNIGNDVRQLEGSLTRLLAYSTIMGGSTINLELAMEALKDFVNKGVPNDQNSIRKIQKVVANHYKINYEDLKSKKRTNDIAIPRQVAMYLCRELTNESFPRIGLEFGNKDHTTVMHSCNKIRNELQKNAELRNSINQIEKQLH